MFAALAGPVSFFAVVSATGFNPINLRQNMRRQSQFFVGRVVFDVVIVAVGAELVAVVGFVCRGNSPRIAHCGHADARALRQGCQRNHETLVIGKIEVRAFVIRDDYVSGSVHRKSGILIEIDSAADAAGLVISYRTARNCKRTVGILPSAVAEQEYSASVYIAFVVFYNAAVHHKFGAPTGGNTAAVTVSDVIFDDAVVQSNLAVRFHADTAAAPCRGISSDTAAVHNEIKKNRKVFVESALIFRNKTDYMKNAVWHLSFPYEVSVFVSYSNSS